MIGRALFTLREEFLRECSILIFRRRLDGLENWPTFLSLIRSDIERALQQEWKKYPNGLEVGFLHVGSS